METDRELFELAAKAAAIDGEFHGPIEGMWSVDFDDYWNPLTNDGDALRLAVNLRIDVDHGGLLDNSKYVRASRPGIEMMRNPCSVVEEFEYEMQRGAATRRAITRAAAEIGREKQKKDLT